MASTTADAARRVAIKLSALAQDGLAYAAPATTTWTGTARWAGRLTSCYWDRERQDNPPPLPVHVYKLFFLCRRDWAVQPPAALETLDVGWFGVHALPPQSLGRVNHRQLERALAHHRDPSLPSEFD